MATTRRPSSCGSKAALRCLPASSWSATTPPPRSWFTTIFPASSGRTRTAQRRWRTAGWHCSAISMSTAIRFHARNTLLIDSEQLESGEALDDNFRAMAADEIERFRREIIERTGDRSAGGGHHRSGTAARGDEHGRQVRPTGRIHPLRGFRLDADRRMGCQYRDPRAGRARVRHAVTVRTGDRPGAAPAILRPE